MAEHVAVQSEAHGKTVVGTEAPGGGHAPEPQFLGLGPAWFVSAAMVVVIAILIWKVPGAMGRALDKRIGAIRASLKEAEQLRAEAETLRNEYESKLTAAGAEAETMIERARAEADGILLKADADAAALVERRTRMAEDKIGAAERAALQEVRARAASAAATAAARLISEKLDAETDRPLVDRTIESLGQAS
jgi:F-type H+-transporting ATPase subunit b